MTDRPTRRRTRAVPLDGANRGQWQVKYFDPTVEVWCDYGDPVSESEVDAKMARCERGESP